MSMHMIQGVQVHGKSHKKKRKLSDNQLKKLEVEWRQYNKSMRQKHMHDLQFKEFDDYVAYTRGEHKPRAKKEFKEYEGPKPINRNQPSYPSVTSSNSIPGACARKERQEYTGDYIVGLATMHKSNIVPVGRGSDPKEYAQMRRN